MIKAFIFDFFGVLFTDSFDDVYRHFGGDPVKDKALIEEAFDFSHKGKIERSSEVFSKHLGVEIKEWERAIDSERVLDERLFEYIGHLRETHKTAVLSNIGERGLAAYIDIDYFSKNFDALVESSKVGHAKPDKVAYFYTAEKLGVQPEECIFIDDRQRYIDGAQAAGMQTILYKNFEQFKKDVERVLA